MKILLVDDQRLFRSAFARLLKSICTDTINIFEEASNGREALLKLKKSKFDLAFLDVSMPTMDGYEASRLIRLDHPDVSIIILTQFDDHHLIYLFFKIGVHSFLTKDASIDSLKLAIDSLRAGKRYFPPEIEEIIRKKSESEKTDFIQKIELTQQEKRLLQLLQEGLTSKEIATKMKLTINTVNTYRDRLLTKTNSDNVAKLISFGFRAAILK